MRNITQNPSKVAVINPAKSGLLTTISCSECTLSLLSNDHIDWSGKYVFDANGRLDYAATLAKKSGAIDCSLRPLPNISEAEKESLAETKQQLEQILTPPTKLEFAAIISRLGFHCGMQDRHPETAKLIGEDYFNDFGHYPKVLIELACQKWRKKSEGNQWMPKSGDFINLMYSEHYYLKKLLSRLKKLLGEEVEEEQNKNERTNEMMTLGQLLLNAKHIK